MPDKYLMGRNVDASQRLNLSHRMWADNVGYLLHPSIMSALGPSPRIADIATGTSIWLSEMSEALPQSTLVGFDISSAQFPRSIPANVSLHVADAKQPFPAEFHGTFDAVHVRLLVTAMDREDWAVVVANVAALLKPGGALQWDEAAFSNLAIHRAGVSSTMEWLERLEMGFVDAYRHRLQYGWSTLPREMARAGLQVTRDRVASDRVAETRENMTRVLSVGVFEWAQALMDAGTPVWTDSELNELTDLVERDVRSGAYCRFDIHIAVGRKPQV